MCKLAEALIQAPLSTSSTSQKEQYNSIFGAIYKIGENLCVFNKCEELAGQSDFYELYNLTSHNEQLFSLIL